MRVAQLHRPVVAAASRAATPAAAATTTGVALRQLQDALAGLKLGTSSMGSVEGRRYASVKSQGAYRLRDSSTIPKNLGAKKTGDSYVIPGNIIYKQRGTIWFPGENCGMGRDHTIFSLATGYVKYYKDPAKHPDRQYIGVVFNKEDKLPYPKHAVRKRRLNLTASVIPAQKPLEDVSASGIPNTVIRTGTGRNPNPRDTRIYKLVDDGSYRYKEDNWRLGTLVRTEKRKTGSRRVAMRHRRKRTKAIQAEMRRDREDKLARRKEATDERHAAHSKKMSAYYARQKAAEAAAATPGSAPAPAAKA
ncbi:ribosomal L27 protein-domain-containing protein [Xylariales sp. PMI_506]|nr:ribosomal L27 protein-domain-containing protein [Xylariales sp. PMI_506]